MMGVPQMGAFLRGWNGAVIVAIFATYCPQSCPSTCQPYYIKEGEKCDTGFHYWAMGNGFAQCECPKETTGRSVTMSLGYQDAPQGVLDHLNKLYGDEEEVLTEEEAITKLDLGITDYRHSDACCSLVGLRSAGWSVRRQETDTGFCIFFNRPGTI